MALSGVGNTVGEISCFILKNSLVMKEERLERRKLRVPGRPAAAVAAELALTWIILEVMPASSIYTAQNIYYSVHVWWMVSERN